jgi:hypothetical protein
MSADAARLTVWLSIGVAASLLIVLAAPVGRWAWSAHGKPYGVGSVKKFQIAYAIFGCVSLGSAALAVVRGIALDPMGLVLMAAGLEVVLHSRAIAVWHHRWVAVGSLRAHQTQWVGIGSLCLIVGTLVLFGW